MHWNVPGWYECSTENKPCKQVRARTPVSRACTAHGLQCLCVRGACCPSLPKQLVILYVEVCLRLPIEKVSEWSLLIVYHCLNPLQRCVLLPGWYTMYLQGSSQVQYVIIPKLPCRVRVGSPHPQLPLFDPKSGPKVKKIYRYRCTHRYNVQYIMYLLCTDILYELWTCRIP